MENKSKIYSELQYVAVEVANFCNEPKKVGIYISAVKRIGIQKAYQIMSEMKQSEGIKNRAAVFMARSRKFSPPDLNVIP